MISCLAGLCLTLVYQQRSFPIVHGKPANEWIHYQAFREHPIEFEAAVHALGPDLWNLLEDRLSKRDNALDRMWIRIYPRLPKRLFKQPKAARENIIDVLNLIDQWEDISDKLEHSLVSLIDFRSDSDWDFSFFRIKTVNLIGKLTGNLNKDTIIKLRYISSKGHHADLKFAAYCTLSRKDIKHVKGIDDLVSMGDELTIDSSVNVNWILHQPEQEVSGFWESLLKHNPPLAIQALFPQNLALLQDSNRIVELLTAAVRVQSSLSAQERITVLGTVSSYCDLFDRKTIDLRIIPAFLKALENGSDTEKEYAARGIYNFDPPPEMTIHSLKKAQEAHPHPEFFDRYIELLKEKQ